MADPTFEEWQAKNAGNPDFVKIQHDPIRLRTAYRETYATPSPTWQERTNSALSSARQFVQPAANALVNLHPASTIYDALSGRRPSSLTGSPTTGLGRAAADFANPVPSDLQGLGGMAANIGANLLLPGATAGRMLLRPAITGLGSLLGGALEGNPDLGQATLATGAAGLTELPGLAGRMRAGINQRGANTAAAAGYLSEASGAPVPPTPEGIAAARQKTGQGSLEEPMWAAYRKKFQDAIALTQDRPVSVTTGAPGEARMTEMMPLSQAWDRMSSLGDFYQKRRMMDEILTSLRTPLGGPGYQVPPSPEAASLIEGANAPVRRTMSALDLARSKGALSPETGDVNMAVWQAAHQKQLMGQGGADIPGSLQDPARQMIRRGDAGAAVDQPGNISGFESGRANIGEGRMNAYLSPFRIYESQFPKIVGAPPVPGPSPAVAPLVGGVSRLGAMPQPQEQDLTMTQTAPGPGLMDRAMGALPTTPDVRDAIAQQAELRRRLQELEDQQR